MYLCQFLLFTYTVLNLACAGCVCVCVVPELWPRHCVSCNKLLTFSPYCRHDEWLSVGLINSAERWLVVHRVCACPLLSWLIYFQGQHACPTGSALLDILGTEQKKKNSEQVEQSKWERWIRIQCLLWSICFSRDGLQHVSVRRISLLHLSLIHPTKHTESYGSLFFHDPPSHLILPCFPVPSSQLWEQESGESFHGEIWLTA